MPDRKVDCKTTVIDRSRVKRPRLSDADRAEYLMVIAKYINVVGREEGVDFLHRRDWTEREWQILDAASQIARALDPNWKFADINRTL